MKRITLLLIMLLCLLGQGAMAQGQLPARVSYANAASFVKAHPEFTDHFTFQSDGAAYCADASALVAFQRFEQSNGSSTTSVPTAPAAQKEEGTEEVFKATNIIEHEKGQPQQETVKPVEEPLKIDEGPTPTAYPEQQ